MCACTVHCFVFEYIDIRLCAHILTSYGEIAEARIYARILI